MTNEEAQSIMDGLTAYLPQGIIMLFDPEKEGAYIEVKGVEEKHLAGCILSVVQKLVADGRLDGEQIDRLMPEYIARGIMTRAMREEEEAV